MTTRSDIINIARLYIDTPFAHAQRSPGVGLDCAGLIICVGRETGIFPPAFDVPPYSMEPDGHSMIALCDTYMDRVSQTDMRPGDIVVLRRDGHPQHLGIVSDHVNGGLGIIHASNSRSVVPPRVIETRLMFSRAQRFVAAYALRGIQ